MPKPIAYIETTVPNFYYDLRTSEAVVTRRAWTRQWWDSAAERYELVTSGVVFEELAAGTSRLVPLRLSLIKHLPVLPTRSEVEAAARTYVQNKLMPANPGADAAHVALASWYNCDFIVTWNCKHLANPNKILHLRRINERLGLRVPEIVTPLQLLRRG